MIYQLVPKVIRWMIQRRVYVTAVGHKGRVRALLEAPLLYLQIRDANPQHGHVYAMQWTMQSIMLSRWFNKPSGEFTKR